MDGKEIREILGSSVKEIRTANSFTQEYLGELIGKQSHTINRIETGLNFVTSDTLAKLSDVLKVHPSVLFSVRPQFLLKDHINYVKQINQILQTMSTDKLRDIYNIICVMSK